MTGPDAPRAGVARPTPVLADADGGPAPIAIGAVISAGVMLLAARVAWRTLGPREAGVQ